MHLVSSYSPQMPCYRPQRNDRCIVCSVNNARGIKDYKKKLYICFANIETGHLESSKKDGGVGYGKERLTGNNCKSGYKSSDEPLSCGKNKLVQDLEAALCRIMCQFN